jgi:hypothetical protein
LDRELWNHWLICYKPSSSKELGLFPKELGPCLFTIQKVRNFVSWWNVSFTFRSAHGLWFVILRNQQTKFLEGTWFVYVWAGANLLRCNNTNLPTF